MLFNSVLYECPVCVRTTVNGFYLCVALVINEMKIEGMLLINNFIADLLVFAELFYLP